MFVLQICGYKNGLFLKKRTRTNGTESQVTGTTNLFVNTSSSWNCFKPTVFPGLNIVVIYSINLTPQK